MGRSDSEACPCQRHCCAWLDGSQGVAAPSKDHLRGFSNTSLIALLVLSVKHRSLRCILVVVAQADLALQACQALQHWEGAVHTHRCELKCSLQVGPGKPGAEVSKQKDYRPKKEFAYRMCTG